MAIQSSYDAFNPGQQEIYPREYLRDSRPISPYTGDTSMSELASGLGKLIPEGINAADTVVKETIDRGIHADVDTQRDQYMDVLTKTDAAARAGRLVPGIGANAGGGGDVAGGGGPAPSLINPDLGKDIPASLQNLGQYSDTLGAARAKGTLSETAYYGRLDALAKDYRSRFPGYRDYIDSTLEKTTGVNPANAYIKSVLGDINSFQTAIAAERGKDENFIREHYGSIPQADAWVMGIRNGSLQAKDMYAVALPAIAADYQHKAKMQALEEFKGNQYLEGNAVTNTMNLRGASLASSNLETLKAFSGLGTEEKVQDLIRRAKAGDPTVNLNTVQWQQIDQLLMANRETLAATLRNEWYTPGTGEDKRSPVERLGPDGQEKAEKIIQGNLKWHDELHAAITDQHTGTAMTATNLSKGEAEDSKRKVFEDPNIGPPIKYLQALKATAGGELADQLYRTTLEDPKLTKDMKNVNSTIIGRIVSQYDPRPLAQQQVYPLGKGVDDQKRANATDPITQTTPNAGVQQIIDLPKLIADPKVNDPTKVKLIQSTFGDENSKFISKFDVDRMTAKGFVPGQTSIFHDYTTPGITAEVRRIAQTSNPELWGKYSNWVKTTFGSELLPRELADLREAQLDPRLQITWNTETSQFKVEPMSIKPPVPIAGLAVQHMVAQEAARAQYHNVNEAVTRINKGLEGVRNVAQAEGSDPTTYIYKMLGGMGYLSGVGGVGKDMVEAVEKSRTFKPKEQK